MRESRFVPKPVQDLNLADSFKEETLNHRSQSCTGDGFATLSLHDNGSVQLTYLFLKISGAICTKSKSKDFLNSSH